MSEVFALIAKGGWLMVPIVACSIIGLAIFLERLWHLQRTKILPSRFLEVVSRLLQEGRFADAEALCHQNESPVAAVLAAGIRYAGQDREVIKEVMEETGRREIFFMERFTTALGAIATIAPLLGLLGTVIGIYRALINIGLAGSASIDKVAGPVGEALIMTAIGLLVAVPAVFAYNWLMARNKKIAELLTGFSTDLLAYINSNGAVKPMTGAWAKQAAAAKTVKK